MSFIQQYFIDPIIYGTGYNIYNTITYGILFAVLFILIYKLFQHYKLKINKEFFIGMIPFIFLGSALRALQDANILNSFLFITPFVYLMIIALVLVIVPISIKLSTILNRPYHIIWSVIGILLFIATIPFFKIANPLGLVLIISISFAWFIVIFGIKKITKSVEKIQKILTNSNAWLLWAHVFDATTTFVSIQFFPYSEQHVLTGFFISALGPWSIYLVKIPVVLAVLYLLDKDLTDKNQNAFIKLAILILGMGPGLRNMFRLIMGV